MNRVPLLLALLSLTALPGFADIAPAPAPPFVASPFTDNMVLQRGQSDPIWGWTTPGAQVTVSIDGKSVDAEAGTDGRWDAKLPDLPVGASYTLTVAGPQTVTLKNVAVGDVWVCSGQSNMEFGIGNAMNADQEIAAANYPDIRLFLLDKKVALDPQATAGGQWQPCTPDTIKVGGWNGFSAVGYFFGRDLYQQIHVPIGLIGTYWGGTPAQAWVSRPVIDKKFPNYAAQIDYLDTIRIPGTVLPQPIDTWYAANDLGVSSGIDWSADTFDDSAWTTTNVPARWVDSTEADLKGYAGIVWFRRNVDLTDDAAKSGAVLRFSADAWDTVWINGHEIGSTMNAAQLRQYLISASNLKSGANTIAIRVLGTGAGSGIYGAPVFQTLGGQAIDLSGPWRYHLSTAKAQFKPFPPALQYNQNTPTALYNGMINPLIAYGIKGAIWYQGESNAGAAYEYRSLLPAMIDDWRNRWNEGKFPFYIVQLANFQAPPTQPRDDAWAELREAQLLTSENEPNSGLAVAIDVGDAKTIHPLNKQEVGRRLSLVALAKTYGQKIEYSGPNYTSMSVEGSTIRLHFDHIGGGLVAKDGPLQQFAIAGTDHVWHWADAAIDGDTVVVSSKDVPQPVAVRYAWSEDPLGCNLYNQAGLPASPFRTDDWPEITDHHAAAK